jgi:rhodanese-related sulfurtransferase
MKQAMSSHKRPRRIYAWDLAHKLLQGTGAPLVVRADVALTADSRCTIEGTLSLQEFKAKQDSIPKEREIVFYSSSPGDGQAVECAVESERGGYSRVAILEGGISAWSAIAPFLAARRSARGTPAL